ncbi:hypothetical protein E4T56_gene6723 [Termitomyces sp. T112]|nr:hypothetical protein C0989_007969 [Termitomyces sp. Mn162]KAG5725323.1 hypothetical protein E4T56_gene6723 [Termitomyces sp. T112]
MTVSLFPDPSFIDDRYAEFRAFGIIKLNAKQTSDSRRGKELKKRRFEDVNPDGFKLPSSSRTLNSNQKKRSRKGRVAFESSDGDGDMHVHQFIEKTTLAE